MRSEWRTGLPRPYSERETRVPKSACMVCRTLIPLGQTRCPEHRVKDKPRARRNPDRPTASQRGYGSAWQKLRQAIIIRDGKRCQACGHRGDRDNPLSVDHVMPKSKGGTDSASNLITLCRKCNSSKRDR
ncbi:HNH endonuclease [Actinopolymorpha pittospori]